ncbi:hypothetical protein BDQ12DRAFT_668951 [Crucibulum laeve]|uniref:Uncharacterized protein n=1 Tax=Crucibulum laeve TaxID=68775 RepID=A0A5C3LSA0_9AGAR|nr:hypothetical protein BDQ12DRAFT_668951 [Crucibulum laeve]
MVVEEMVKVLKDLGVGKGHLFNVYAQTRLLCKSTGRDLLIHTSDMGHWNKGAMLNWIDRLQPRRDIRVHATSDHKQPMAISNTRATSPPITPPPTSSSASTRTPVLSVRG